MRPTLATTVLVAALALGPAVGLAQESDPFSEFDEVAPEEAELEATRDSGEPIDGKSADELREAGFEFGEERTKKDSSAALLLASTAGVALHGIGHIYLGDTRTGYALLGLEAASLGLIVGGAVFFGLTEGASGGMAFASPLFVAGIAGFLYSFLLDLVGTLQGEELKLESNSGLRRGFGFSAEYGFLSVPNVPLRHLISGQLWVDVGGIYGTVGTSQDVLLDGAVYRGELGVRPLRGLSPMTWLSLEGGVEYLEYQGLGEFGRIAAEGRLGGAYNLGGAFAQFEQLAMGADIGLGNYWYQIAPEGTVTFELATTRLYVPWKVWASMNLSERLNVQGGYGSPEGTFVPAIHRMLGVAALQMSYRSTAYGELTLRTEFGDGFGVWLGGGLGLR